MPSTSTSITKNKSASADQRSPSSLSRSSRVSPPKFITSRRQKVLQQRSEQQVKKQKEDMEKSKIAQEKAKTTLDQVTEADDVHKALSVNKRQVLPEKKKLWTRQDFALNALHHLKDPEDDEGDVQEEPLYMKVLSKYNCGRIREAAKDDTDMVDYPIEIVYVSGEEDEDGIKVLGGKKKAVARISAKKAARIITTGKI